MMLLFAGVVLAPYAMSVTFFKMLCQVKMSSEFESQCKSSLLNKQWTDVMIQRIGLAYLHMELAYLNNLKG